MSTLSAPRHFTAPNTKEFLRKSEQIFTMAEVEQSGFSFDLAVTEKSDVLGLVLIYKFLEYTVRKHCFYKPQCNFNPKSSLYKELDYYGFLGILQGILKQDSVMYDRLKNPAVYNGVIVAPFFLDKESKVDEVSINSSAICNYYQNNQINLSVILTCVSEIASNFRSHSVSDTKSVLAARGNNAWFEFACADTGEGVISSLSSSACFSTSGMQKYEILQQAIQKGVSSKDKKTTEHLGLGLWLVNEFVTISRGEFHLYSEGAYLVNHGGKIKKGLCSYWKGTIVYIKLPLFREKELELFIQSRNKSRKRK